MRLQYDTIAEFNLDSNAECDHTKLKQTNASAHLVQYRFEIRECSLEGNRRLRRKARAPAGFQATVDKHVFGKIRREAPKKISFATLVFSLPTLPYVTVAHPAHRSTLVPTYSVVRIYFGQDMKICQPFISYLI